MNNAIDKFLALPSNLKAGTFIVMIFMALLGLYFLPAILAWAGLLATVTGLLLHIKSVSDGTTSWLSPAGRYQFLMAAGAIVNIVGILTGGMG